MINTRTLAIVGLGLVLSPQGLEGQHRSRYRDFQRGSDVPSVSALANVDSAERARNHEWNT